MRTVRFKITDDAKSWNSLALFTSIWVNEYLKSHEYFRKAGKLLEDDLLLAAQGFFLYYEVIVDPYFPQHSTIRHMVTEGIEQGATDRKIICQVPHQETVYEIENQLSDYWKYLNRLKIKTKDDARMARAKAFRKSITLDKLERLMRWGFKEAHALIPDHAESIEAIRSFFQALDRLPHGKFLAPHFEWMEFEIEDGAQLKWDIFLVKTNGERVHYKDIHKHLQ